jgi:hypothetical protein
MRQQRMNLALILALVGVLVISVGPVQAKNTRITFTGDEVCGDLVGGTITTHDGMTFIRNATLACIDTASNPMGAGSNTVTFNANLDANGYGALWGKAHFATNEGGVWEVNWNQKASATGFHGQAEARGTGQYEGFLAKITLDNGKVGWEILHAAG